MHLPHLPSLNRRRWCLGAALAAAPGFSAMAAGAGGEARFDSHAEQRPEVRNDAHKADNVKLILAVSGKMAQQYLPLTVAMQFGWFKAEGIDVEVSEVASTARAVQALTSGAVDVVCGPYEQTLHMQTRNQFSQAFVMMGLTPQIAFGFSNRAMPGNPSLADLKGRKIGVSAPGSPTHMVASHVVARAGLAPGDVSYISVGSAAGAMAALRSGQIDALCNTDPVMMALSQRGELNIAIDARTRQGTVQLFGGLFPTACLHAPAEFVQRRPQVVQGLTYAMVRALKWLQTTGPSELLKTVPDAYLLGDRALYLAAFNQMREAISPQGAMPDDGPRTVLKALLRFDGSAMRPDQIDLGKSFTNEFVRRAAERTGKT